MEFHHVFNPDWETFPVKLDWTELAAISRELPGAFSDILHFLTEGGDFEDAIFWFLTEYSKVLCRTIGVDEDFVDLEFTLGTGEDIGTTDDYKDEDGILLGCIVSLVKLSHASLEIGAADWKEHQARLLAEMLAEWMFVLTHEMYHVRQDVFAPEYSDESGEAGEANTAAKEQGLEDCPQYDNDLGERGADAVGIRAFRQIIRLLREQQARLPADDELAAAVSDYLIPAFVGRMKKERSWLKRRSQSSRWRSGVYISQVVAVD